MKGWRWTVRARLRSISALTVVALGAMVVVDQFTMSNLDEQLGDLEQHYLPLLEYGPNIDAKLEALRRAMQDAVAAQDKEALAETRAMRSDILAAFSAAPRVVEPELLDTARRAFMAWDDAVYALSERLLRGETGESVVSAVEDMHAKQRQAWADVRTACFLDRARMSKVFADARLAHRGAAHTRNAVRAALIVTITVLSFATARRVVQSFDTLRVGLARFGASDFSQPVQIVGKDELAELGQQANQMAASLRDLQDGLRSKQLELQEANHELEAFSYSVSHDLRAPLRGIDGFSQALLEDYGDRLDAGGKDYLKRVRAAAQRMAELIDDMLSLSRVGRGELRRQQVDVSALATKVVQQLQASQPERRVEWVISAGILASADARLLTVALENLLGNAWKFTGKVAAPRIELGNTSEQGEPAFFVRDNGAGFDMTYASKLFGAFQRLHSASDFEGTGIGLATVNRIVRRHGGRIWAESAPDRGATFYFTLSGGAVA